jgi:hypothetical protein
VAGAVGASTVLSNDDLENYEAERELQLAQEYQDVAAMFRYAVETERRFWPTPSKSPRWQTRRGP